MAQTINVDLKRERTNTKFNVEELTNILDNGEKNKVKRREMESSILSDKNLLDDTPEEYLSHKEKYENAIRKAVLLYRKMQSFSGQALPLQETQEFNFRNSIASAVFKENSPFMLHFGMFVPAIQGQGTEEQKERWLKKAINMEIIGTYAQTELGHGTFIRGLETTATYDVEQEEFILNSPSLTAYKWWPGGLAHTSNYCVVMAQLYTKGKNCGIQPFLVQIRDEDTHMPLPGVKLGEIGAKFNFNTVNNGFLGFDNHRIPRDRMLMKSAQVLKDGTFKASSNPKLVYGTMVYVRVIIVNAAAGHLARAATIAVRYSALRRQSKLKSDEPEIQVLDFLTQQHRLFPALATSYAYFFSARWVWRLYKAVTGDMQQGQVDRLPELHVIACSLKVLSSYDCSAHIERCRLACGGHGYMLSSNLPQLYSVCSAICTYEGENTVLLLQVARSLVKAWEQANKGQTLSPSMAYLSDRSPAGAWDSSVEGVIRSFQKVSVGKLSEAVRSLKENAQKLSPEDAWNMTSVQLIAAAEAHARVLVLSTYKLEVEASVSAASPALKHAMTSLLELYVVYWALEKTGDLLLFTTLPAKEVRALQRRYEHLLTEVRPNAVGLVDAYDYRDEVLNSTLGAYDGRAYERLMEEAMKSPLNQEPVNQTFHTHLKPFMRGKL